MSRRQYKLLHWDYGTNRGIATDGTRYDGESIIFVVRGEDLSEEHNDHLLLNEIFTACEDSAGDHHLYDILIEEGARALPAPYAGQPTHAIDDEQAAFLVSQEASQPQQDIIEGTAVTAAEETLDARVSALEKQVAEIQLCYKFCIRCKVPLFEGTLGYNNFDGSYHICR